MPDAETPPGLVEVQLLGLPVPLWARSQEQHDALLREFALIASDGAAHQLPARLLALLEDLDREYGDLSGEQQRRLDRAARDGVDSIDLVYRVPPGVGPAALALSALLDEADDYCQQGRHLLTLGAEPDVVAFRRWYLRAFAEQTAALPAVPWATAHGTGAAPAT